MQYQKGKVLSIEEFERKLKEQKDPMKLTLSNPMLDLENDEPKRINSLQDNVNIRGNGKNGMMIGGNGLVKTNSDQTLLQQQHYNNGSVSSFSSANTNDPAYAKFLNSSDLTINTSGKSGFNGNENGGLYMNHSDRTSPIMMHNGSNINLSSNNNNNNPNLNHSPHSSQNNSGYNSPNPNAFGHPGYNSPHPSYNSNNNNGSGYNSPMMNGGGGGGSMNGMNSMAGMNKLMNGLNNINGMNGAANNMNGMSSINSMSTMNEFNDNSSYRGGMGGNGRFNGTSDEFDEFDSDEEDSFEKPGARRKPTETEILADFLRNTGPDMLQPPQSPVHKKKRGSLFKFKKGKKKNQKSGLNEELGGGGSNTSSPARHTPIVINYPTDPSQSSLQQQQQQFNASKDNLMISGPPVNVTLPNQFSLMNNPNPNSNNTNTTNSNNGPVVMSLMNSSMANGGGGVNTPNAQNNNNNNNNSNNNNNGIPPIPQIPPNFAAMINNNNNNNTMNNNNNNNNNLYGESKQQPPPISLQQQQQQQPQQQPPMSSQNYMKPRIQGNENNIMNNLPPSQKYMNQNQMMSSKDPNENYPNYHGEPQPQPPPQQQQLRPFKAKRNYVQPTARKSPQRKSSMNVTGIADHSIDKEGGSKSDISPTVKNKIVENLENLSIEVEHGQYDSDSYSDEYYSEGDEEEDEDEIISDCDSELIRNTRYNAKMNSDDYLLNERRYEKSEKANHSTKTSHSSNPNNVNGNSSKKTVQFNENVLKITHSDLDSEVDDIEDIYDSEEEEDDDEEYDPYDDSYYTSDIHDLPEKSMNFNSSTSHTKDSKVMYERRSSRNCPQRHLIPTPMTSSNQGNINKVNLPQPQMGTAEYTITSDPTLEDDFNLDAYSEPIKATVIPASTLKSEPVSKDKPISKLLEKTRASSPLSSNNIVNRVATPPPSTFNHNNQGPKNPRPKVKVRHVQIQTRRANTHSVSVQTTAFTDDIDSLFKNSLEKCNSVESLQHELMNYREVIKRMNSEIQDVTNENQKISNQYRELKHEKERIIENNKRKEMEFDDLSSRAHKKLKELIVDRQQLMNDKQQMESVISKLKKQIETLNESSTNNNLIKE